MTAPKAPQDRKPKASKATEPDVGLDLDALQREGGTPEPFPFQHAGESFTLSDPQEIGLDQIISASNRADITGGNVSLLLVLLGEGEYPRLMNLINKGNSLPAWKINKLVDAWTKHFGIDLGKFGG